MSNLLCIPGSRHRTFLWKNKNTTEEIVCCKAQGWNTELSVTLLAYLFNISVLTSLSLNKILFLRMKNGLARALLYVQWTLWLKQGTFKLQLHQKYVLQCKLWKRQILFSDLLILPGCPSCSRRRMDKRHLRGYEAALVIASWEHLHCLQYKTWGQDLLIC